MIISWIHYSIFVGIGEDTVGKVASTRKPLGTKMNWYQYQRLQTIYDYMLHLESLHPDIVKDCMENFRTF